MSILRINQAKNSMNLFAKSTSRNLVLLLMAFTIAGAPISKVYADTFDDQIQKLQQEAQNYQNEAGRLRTEADNLQNAIAALTAESAALQRQIDTKQVELEQLNLKIQETLVRIDNQQQAMSRNLKSVYVENDISPLEMIFSSKSISDFIDKQEYRNKIRDSITKALDQIRQLKADLEQQKKDVERAIDDQKNMKSQLQAQESEKARILEQTKGEEAAYQTMIGQKSSEIETLRAQQKAANLKIGGGANFQPRGGGYPSYWADPEMDSIVDDWGMYNRECVSYAAFRVANSGRYMPFWGGVGNANQWDGNAQAAGIPVDSNPKQGDIAVWHIGYYGHVMYVEAVSADGSILISEYNYDWSGRYSERKISAADFRAQGFVFIHF